MKYIFLIAFLVSGMLVNAQRNKLPEGVQNTFEEKYPGAEKVKISTKKDFYNIRFTLNEKSVQTVFEKEGGWVKSETKLTKDELPDIVVNSIYKKYSNGKYDEGVYCEQREGGDFYMVDINITNAYIYLEIDPSGKILKTEKIEMPKETPSQSSDGNDD